MIVVLWICCGIVAFGVTHGYFCGAYPSGSKTALDYDCADNRHFAAAFALGGPISLVISYVVGGFAAHGMRFKRCEFKPAKETA